MVMVEIYKHSNGNIYFNAIHAGYKFLINEIFEETNMDNYWDTREYVIDEFMNDKLKPINNNEINTKQGYSLVNIRYKIINQDIYTSNSNSFTEYFKFVGLINYLHLKINNKRIGIKPMNDDWESFPLDFIRKGYLSFFVDLSNNNNVNKKLPYKIIFL